MAINIHKFSDLDRKDLSILPEEIQTARQLEHWIYEKGKILHYNVHPDCQNRTDGEMHIPQQDDAQQHSLYCDGSSAKNVGGWAFRFRTGETGYKEGMGAEKDCDSTRAELLAAVHGIAEVKAPDSVHVYTDNAFVASVLRALELNERELIEKLLSRNEKNRDLITELQRKAEEIYIICSQVGRNSTSELKKCDDLAREAQRSFEK